MKSTLFDSQGNKKGQIELPQVFETPIREDIAAKYFEVDKFIQPYSPKDGAGLRQSASGTISHKRHDWKGHYGKGISRVPRKTMWRRGTQFFWVAANVPGTRGGRASHPPKGIGKEKKFNKKEIKIAMDSAIAATASIHYIEKRYSSINKIEHAPMIIETLPKKTKELVKMIQNSLGEMSNLAFKNKSVRAGKGKSRGRKYKSNAGVLLVTAKDEKEKFSGIDIRKTNELAIADLYPLGRLTIYTKKALEEIGMEEKVK